MRFMAVLFGVSMLFSAVIAQWEPDVRLTNNHSTMHMAAPNNHPVVASGDSVYAVFVDDRTGKLQSRLMRSFDAAGPATDDDVTWTGAGGDNQWNNPANWHTNSVPGRDDNVTVPDGTPECVITDNNIEVNQLVNHGTVTCRWTTTVTATARIENHGTLAGAEDAHVALISSQGELLNYGQINAAALRLAGDGVGNAAGGSIRADREILIEGGAGDVSNLGTIRGEDMVNSGSTIRIDADGFYNEGQVRAGNCTAGEGSAGDVIVQVNSYDNRGVVRGGDNLGSGRGGELRVYSHNASNSDTVKAGDASVGKGGSVEFEVGDFMNFAEISPGGGPLGVGELRITCPTGEILNYGSLGRETGDNEYVGNVYLAGHRVELCHMPSGFINADTLVVVGRSIVVNTLGPDGRILADNDNRFYVLPGNGVLNLSNADTMGVNALGANLLFADSIIPPIIGYGLVFSPDPTISGPDTTLVSAGISGLWVADSAGSSDTLTVCITNLGTAARIVSYNVTTSRGWLAPLSGATPLLHPLESRWVRTTYAIPDTAATGSRDSIIAVLTAVPGFADTSFGEVYCSDGVVGIQEKPNATVRTPKRGPSIVRGVLELAVDSRQHTAYRAELLDATGRRAAVLRPGPNDVSRLGPGVYFIRGRGAGVGGRSAVRKVVIQR